VTTELYFFVTNYEKHQNDDCSVITSNSSSQLHILGHNGHSFGVDSEKIAIFEQGD
jgi:hypothetical protein